MSWIPSGVFSHFKSENFWKTACGEWGQRWARSKLPHGELHPSTLMWDIHRFLKTEHFPAARTVLNFEFTDLKAMRHWWLIVQAGEVDVCLDDPGYEVDLWIGCTLLTLTQVFMGDLSIARAKATGLLNLSGSGRLIKDMSVWFGLMPFSKGRFTHRKTNDDVAESSSPRPPIKHRSAR